MQCNWTYLTVSYQRNTQNRIADKSSQKCGIKKVLWSGLNSWCLKKTVWNLATGGGGGKANAHVIVFVERVVWRDAAFYEVGGGGAQLICFRPIYSKLIA